MKAVVLVGLLTLTSFSQAVDDPRQILAAADLVIVGRTVESRREGEFRIVTVEVSGSLKGSAPSELDLVVPDVAVSQVRTQAGSYRPGFFVDGVGVKAVYALQRRTSRGFLEDATTNRKDTWTAPKCDWAMVTRMVGPIEQIVVYDTEFDAELPGPVLRLADLMLRNASRRPEEADRYLEILRDCSPKLDKVDGYSNSEYLPGERPNLAEAWFRREFPSRWSPDGPVQRARGLAVSWFWLDDEDIEDRFIEAYLAAPEEYGNSFMPTIKRSENTMKMAEFAPPGIAGSYIGTNAFLKDEGTKRHLLRIALARLGESGFLDSRICEAVAIAFDRPEIRPQQPYHLSNDLDLTANKEALRRLAEELGMDT